MKAKHVKDVTDKMTMRRSTISISEVTRQTGTSHAGAQHDARARMQARDDIFGRCVEARNTACNAERERITTSPSRSAELRIGSGMGIRAVCAMTRAVLAHNRNVIGTISTFCNSVIRRKAAVAASYICARSCVLGRHQGCDLHDLSEASKWKASNFARCAAVPTIASHTRNYTRHVSKCQCPRLNW